ncbi:MAG: disulfide bond formation protein B [Azoarcus sp.]|jgi:disulfide bond formation protein DsbB|nr:disulfide bond formation protein B [Azoarcus sp.]
MSFPRLPLRLYFFALFALCAGEVCFGAIYLQGMLGIEPCPMCIMQRYALLGVGIVALAGALHNRAGILYGALVTLVALAGGGVAARQSWLQLYPPNTMSCGPGLEFMLQSFPLTEVLPKLFRGEGDCSAVDWTLFGLSIANWGLITFVAIAIVTPWVVWLARRTGRG